MEPFRYHVYACDQQKPEGVPCCTARGSAATIDALRAELARRGLANEVQVTACGSLGLCENGPNLVVYPEGIWYSGVTAADVAELVEAQFVRGVPLERLVRRDAAALRGEIVANRDKLLAARRAQDASGMLPDEWNDRVRGFMESRAILSALELDLFNAIGAGATAAEIAAKAATDARATEMLLNVLVSLKLIAKQDGVFRNTPVSTRYFTAGSPDDQRLALMHTVHLWTNWSKLTDAVRAGTSVGVAARDAAGTEAFIAAMHRNAAARSELVLRAVDPAKVGRMLDVGGGSGAYSIAFAKANPALRAEILDLGPVTELARRYVAAAGVSDRVAIRIGDLRTDALGEGYDLIFISAICHMLGVEENRDLLRRAFRALAPGGRVVIQEFILEADKSGPKVATLFSLNMLVGTHEGASYSALEMSAWLTETGFNEVRHVRLPGPTGLMIAQR